MIQRLIKRLKGSAGYTLTEMTAVVATAGVLTAVMLPVAISQIQQGRVTAAAGEVQTIGGAIPAILKDTSDYPMRSGSGADFSTRYNKNVLFSTDEDGETTVVDSTSLNTLFDTGTPVSDTFDVHFFTNAGDLYTNWKGPYLTKKKLDPWGASYVIYLEGVEEAADPTGDGTTDKNIMVLSAGPNGVIETVGTATSPSGDDIVAVFGQGGT